MCRPDRNCTDDFFNCIKLLVDPEKVIRLIMIKTFYFENSDI